mgnify:CR=1 FL=1
MRWDDSASRSPRASSSLPKGTHPRSEEARTRGGLSGDSGKEEAVCPLPGTGAPVTWARRTKMRSAPDPAPLEPTKLGRNRGGGNVVIWRDLPTGKGERPSSHTPKPEDDNRGRGRSPGIRPGKNPTNEDSSRTLTHPPGKERDLPSAIDSVSVREEGEKSRGIRKAFVRRQRRKREPEGGPDRRPVRRQGKPL